MKPINNLRFWIILVACLALAGQTSAQGCVDSPAGLVGWWPGDGSGTDVEGKADAKLMNGATFASGFVGEAFSLDGVAAGQDDSVVLSRMAADGLADMTFEFWVNTTDDRGALVSAANGNDRSANELLLIQNANGLVMWVKQESSGVLPVSVNDGGWRHVAFVREGPMGRLYVDGAMRDERSYPEGPLDIGPLGFLLGQDQDCLGGCFETDQALDGVVDEMAVYGRALSETEILAIVDTGAAGKCKPPTMVSEDAFLAERVESLELEVDDLMDQVAALEVQVAELESGTHVHDEPQPSHSDNRWWDEHRDDDDRRGKRGKKHKKLKRQMRRFLER